MRDWKPESEQESWESKQKSRIKNWETEKERVEQKKQTILQFHTGECNQRAPFNLKNELSKGKGGENVLFSESLTEGKKKGKRRGSWIKVQIGEGKREKSVTHTHFETNKCCYW